MTSRTRVWVLAVSVPVIIFALVGGYLGQVMAKDDTYQHLRVFDDVVAHVVNNYVEEVDIKQAMRGAMRGLADALDPDSAYLTPDLVKAYESNNNPGPADIGVELTDKSWYLTTHKIDPDVDFDRDYLLQDLLLSGAVAQFGYVGGVGASMPADPRVNLVGDPYITDGLRLVVLLGPAKSRFLPLEELDWDPPPRALADN